MGINSTEVVYGFGQMGSLYCATAGSTVKPPEGKVFVAITCVAACTFDVLTDERKGTVECIGGSTPTVAHAQTIGNATADVGELGEVITGVAIPAGVTFYGRWTSASTSGATGFIAYIGE